MGAKPNIQYTVTLQSSRNRESRTYLVSEHCLEWPLRTFTVVVYAHSSDESRLQLASGVS